MPKRNTEKPKIETRVWLNREISKKADNDIGKRGASRSEVIRSIVEDYYNGNLISGADLLNAIQKGKIRISKA